MIRILIVDDSETETAILRHILEQQADFKVVGCAKNGDEAVKYTAILKPDIITMDIKMPVMDGFEATSAIMSQTPTPIVVISSILKDESLNATFRALDAGALSVLGKPYNITSSKGDYERKHLVETIRSMAEIKVIKRRMKPVTPPHKPLTTPIEANRVGAHELIAIGASVGGTQALNSILSKLPISFPLPIVIVQHMMPGFINGFAKWLDDNSNLNARCANNNEILQKGTVYFAPDHAHLEIIRQKNHLMTKLIKSPPLCGFCPSITVLLESVARVSGKRAIGILLTGMGSDGSEGLLALKKANGHTLIQDKESSVVFGMASVAQSLGAVDKEIQLNQLADYLIKITATKSK